MNENEENNSESYIFPSKMVWNILLVNFFKGSVQIVQTD